MQTTLPSVTRRPATPADEALLQELFLSSHPELMQLPPDVLAPLAGMQLRARNEQYAAAYPRARHEILVAGATDVGRLLVDHGPDAVRIVDVAVLPGHRGQGFASAALTDVSARAGGRPLRLSVWSENQGARRLYERLGFEVLDGDEDGYLEMQQSNSQEVC